MNLGRVLELVVTHLSGQEHPCALGGGLGLAALGLPRATLDLDLVVPAAAQGSLIEFMEDLGYETLYRSSGYSNHHHPKESLGRVDFIYVSGRTSDSIFSAATEIAGPDGVPVLVPRPEHLAAMKVLAMKNDPQRRFQDLADIARLLELPGIDRDEIRGYFEQHGLRDSWDELS